MRSRRGSKERNLLKSSRTRDSLTSPVRRERVERAEENGSNISVKRESKREEKREGRSELNEFDQLQSTSPPSSAVDSTGDQRAGI